MCRHRQIGIGPSKEYVEHLELVQRFIGFRYVRGHGLFCDDVGIYREYEMVSPNYRKVHEGGTSVFARVEIDEFIAFVKRESDCLEVFHEQSLGEHVISLS